MKIFEQFPNVKRVTDAEIGIEIEAEGSRLWPQIDRAGLAKIGQWTVTRDGSLRGENPAEYVLTKPIPRAGVTKALRELIKWHKEHESIVDNSDRAGVHIHINVQDLTVEETINFILMYLLYEDLLVKFCGESREGNLFCLRSRDAEKFLETLRIAKTTSNLVTFQQDSYRYASINVSALRKYGTLEFRAFRTPTKLLEIEDWINLLLSIKDASLKITNSRDIVEHFSRSGPMLYTKKVFGPFAELLKFPDMSTILYDSARRIQDIAYAQVKKKDNRTYKSGLDDAVENLRAAARIRLNPPVFPPAPKLPEYPGLTVQESDRLIDQGFELLELNGGRVGTFRVGNHDVTFTRRGDDEPLNITIDGNAKLPVPPKHWYRRNEYGVNILIITNQPEPDDILVPDPQGSDITRYPDGGIALIGRQIDSYTRPYNPANYLHGWVNRYGAVYWAYNVLPTEAVISTNHSRHPISRTVFESQEEFDDYVWGLERNEDEGPDEEDIEADLEDLAWVDNPRQLGAPQPAAAPQPAIGNPVVAVWNLAAARLPQRDVPLAPAPIPRPRIRPAPIGLNVFDPAPDGE